MILITHIIIATASIVFASYMLARPSTTKLHVNYGLIAATVASGTYLIVITGTPLLSVCSTGLIYCLAVVPASLIAKRKLSSK